jgi:hypothetical protein
MPPQMGGKAPTPGDSLDMFHAFIYGVNYLCHSDGQRLVAGQHEG